VSALLIHPNITQYFVCPESIKRLKNNPPMHLIPVKTGISWDYDEFLHIPCSHHGFPCVPVIPDLVWNPAHAVSSPFTASDILIVI
jgi:hypothetical protein